MSHLDISKKRHLAKTLTWRVIASATTFALALLFFRDDPSAAKKATGVAIAESLVKMVFYYLHERIWYKSNWGINHKRHSNEHKD